jgi:Fe-S cluster assembly ATPase SufC
MAQENITVLLITHRDELVGVADSASLLCNGEIVRTGNAEELRDYYVERCRPHGDALGQQPWSCEPVGFYERIAAREREE